MQRRQILSECGDGLEQAQDALALHPVADAHQRHAAAETQILRRAYVRRNVAARRNDHDLRRRLALSPQLFRQRLAGDQDALKAPVCQPVQMSLYRRPYRPEVDAARRLVQHANRWQPDWGKGQAPGDDAVEDHDIRSHALECADKTRSLRDS